MAIIACPECGEKISDTVKKCVHCGVKIKVCPECRKVYTEDVSFCAECGCVFKEEPSKVVKQEEPLDNAREVYSRWEKSIGALKHLFSEYIEVICGLLIILLAILTAVEFFSWSKTDSVSDTVSSINTYLILIIVVKVLVGALYTFKEHIKTVIFKNWCVSKKIDLNSALGKTLKVDFDSLELGKAKKEIESARWCVYAATYIKNAVLSTKTIIFNAIYTIAGDLALIFGCVFLSTNLEIYLWVKYLLGSDKWKFSMIEDWPFAIVTIVFLAVSIFGSVSAENTLDSARKAYVEQTLPDCCDAYEKYIPEDTAEEYINCREKKHNS